MSDTCMNHLERYWKTLTLSSNENFVKKNYREALDGYTEALYRAEVLNNHWEQCARLKIPVIQVYIISCNNLANTYEELNELPKAQAFLKRAIYFLIHLLETTTITSDCIQGDLKKALLTYADFSQRTHYTTTDDPTFHALVDAVVKN